MDPALGQRFDDRSQAFMTVVQEVLHSPNLGFKQPTPRAGDLVAMLVWMTRQEEDFPLDPNRPRHLLDAERLVTASVETFAWIPSRHIFEITDQNVLVYSDLYRRSDDEPEENLYNNE